MNSHSSMALIAGRRRCQEIGGRNIFFSLLALCFIYLSVLTISNFSENSGGDTLLNKFKDSETTKYWKRLFIQAMLSRDHRNSSTLMNAIEQNQIIEFIQNQTNAKIERVIEPQKPILDQENKKQHPYKNKLKASEKYKNSGKIRKTWRTSITNETFVEPEISSAGLPVRVNAKHRKNYEVDVLVQLDHEWTPKMAKARKKVFKSRSNHIEDTCKTQLDWKKYSEPKMEKMDRNFRWASKYNLLWCPVFKSASTTWVKNFLSLAGEQKVTGSLHGRVRALYPPPKDGAQKTRMLSSAMKMIIVRHPLDRLMSAYRDKMLRILRDNDPYHLIQIDIAKHYEDPYRPHNKDITSSHGEDQPSFNQFLLRVKDDMHKHVSKLRQFKPINLHWRPYWTTCSPCQIKYDVIAKVETLDEDQEYIIHEAKLEGLAFNARTHASNFDKYNGTSDATRAYFSSVPRSLLNDIVQLYMPDFKLFDYSPDEYLQLTVPDI